MKEVFDVIRQRWVSATPEELVRQQWIQRMIGQLQFPRELLAIERELKILPHLASDQRHLPSRRIDLLCFMKASNEMKPLLLIECKKGSLTEEAMDQAMGYNHYVQAPYVAIVNALSIRLRYQLVSERQELFRLPSYRELMESLHG